MLTISSPHLYRKLYYLNPGEVLTGKVQGRDASDLEERFAIYHQKMQISFEYEWRLNPLAAKLTPEHQNIAGEIEIDFLTTHSGVMYPFFIQGDISHFYADWMKERDNQKVAAVDDFLRSYGAHASILIPFWLLQNQEMTDNLIRSGYANGWSQKYYE